MRIHGTVNFCLTSKTIRSKWSMGFLRFSRLKLIMRLKNRSRGMTTPNWTNMWLICSWCALWLPTVIFFFIKTYNLFIKPNTLIILKLQILNFYLRKLVFFFFSKSSKLFLGIIWMVTTAFLLFILILKWNSIKLYQKKILWKTEFVDSGSGVWSDGRIKEK